MASPAQNAARLFPAAQAARTLQQAVASFPGAQSAYTAAQAAQSSLSPMAAQMAQASKIAPMASAVPAAANMGSAGMNAVQAVTPLGAQASNAGSHLAVAGDFEAPASQIVNTAKGGAGGKLAGMFGEGGKFAEGSLGRAGLYGAAGVIGGQLENKLVGEHAGTTLDEAGTGAVTGAGIGAGLGSIVPGVGTLLGGLAGGAIGAGIGYFGPKSTGGTIVPDALAKQTEILNKLGGQLGLDAETISQLGASLQVGSMGATTKAQIEQAAQTLASQLPALAQQNLATHKANVQALAVQSAMGQFTNPYLQEAATQNALTHSQMMDAANATGGTTGALLAKNAQQHHSAGADLIAAYATQMQMAPQSQAIDQSKAIQAQVQQQLNAKLAGTASAAIASPQIGSAQAFTP